MKKTLLVALFVLPFFLSSALAGPVGIDGRPTRELPSSKSLTKPILKIGNQLPKLNVIHPAHVPVPAGSTGIGPGSQLIIEMKDIGAFICTANFVWTSSTTTTTPKGKGKGGDQGKGKGGGGSESVTTVNNYLGAAGHCFIPSDDPLTPENEGKTSTHGSDADYDPALTTVHVCVSDCEFGGQLGPFFGAWGEDRGLGIHGTYVQLGPVVYARQTKDGADVGNDFGIVQIPNSLSDQIRPAMPVWAGPSGVEDVPEGGGVCVYGNGVATGEVFVTKARPGVGEGVSSDRKSWSSRLPSTPGDSGSGIVTCGQDSNGLHGRGAAGILTHISVQIDGPHIVGTTPGRAAQMALEDAGIPLSLVLENGAKIVPPPPPEPPARGEPTGGQRVVSREYAVGAEGFIECGDGTTPDVGGACFDLVGDEFSVRIEINDDAVDNVGAIYEIRNADDNVLGSEFICNSGDAVIPAGAARLLVFLSGPVVGTFLTCPDAPPGAATTGSVTSTFGL